MVRNVISSMAVSLIIIISCGIISYEIADILYRHSYTGSEYKAQKSGII